MSGSLLRIFYYVVMALVIGTAAQYLTGYRKQRIFTTFILGFVGVLAGDFIAHNFNLPHIIPPVMDISILWSIAGCIVFILAFRLLRGQW